MSSISQVPHEMVRKLCSQKVFVDWLMKFNFVWSDRTVCSPQYQNQICFGVSQNFIYSPCFWSMVALFWPPPPLPFLQTMPEIQEMLAVEWRRGLTWRKRTESERKKKRWKWWYKGRKWQTWSPYRGRKVSSCIIFNLLPLRSRCSRLVPRLRNAFWSTSFITFSESFNT